MFKHEMGCTAVDEMTGFKGRIVGRCDYLTGCNQYLLKPKKTKQGVLPASHWFDEDQLIIREPPDTSNGVIQRYYDRGRLARSVPGGPNPDAPST